MALKKYIEVCIRQLFALLNSNGTLYAGSTNSPNIEKSNTNLNLNLNSTSLSNPFGRLLPILCIPLHLPAPVRPVTLHHKLRLVRLCASQFLSAPTFFVRLAVNRKRGEQQILPQIPVRSLPRLGQKRRVLGDGGVHPVVAPVVLPILRVNPTESLRFWPERGGTDRADSGSSASGRSSGCGSSSCTPAAPRAVPRRASRTSSKKN